MAYSIEPIKGIFVSESKNRFISKVKVNDEVVECYVPSSSRIDNYLKLDECEVILTENKAKKSRTKYSLFAVKSEKEYIILNLNKVNSILEDLVVSKSLYPEALFRVYREKVIEGYKSDLLLKSVDKSIIIEAKGIIAKESKVTFPQVNSERAILQLKALEKLLHQGNIVHYYLVSLSPFIKEIEIDTKTEYYYHLNRCMNSGLSLRGICIEFDGKSVRYSKDISIRC